MASGAADTITLPVTPASAQPQGSTLPPALTLDLLDAIDARIKAQREGLPVPAYQPPSAQPQAPAAPPQLSSEQPQYVVRGAGPMPIADLLAQSERQAQGIRQPEWWAEGLVGGGTAVGYSVAHLFDDTEFDTRIALDPLYRELRRAALLDKLRTSLREASAFTSTGREDMARLKLKHVAAYKREIEAIDSVK